MHNQNWKDQKKKRDDYDIIPQPTGKGYYVKVIKVFLYIDL